METTVQNEKKPSTFNTHFFKSIIGALAVALVGAFFTSYAFYYRTNSSIDELNNTKTETKQDIKDLKKDVSEIKTALSNTGIYTNNNQEEIKALKEDVRDIKKSQDEMLKVLYEIKAKQ